MYLTPCEIADLQLRTPRPRFGDPGSQAPLRPATEPDAHRHCGGLIPVAARAHLDTLQVDDLPD